MKRIGLILIAILLMAFPLFSQNVSVPDTAFLNALIELGVDANEDSLISYTEAEAIINLDVGEQKIFDMTGIEAFVNLEWLSCRENQLTNMDVSNNSALTSLDCSRNQLDNLKVTNNLALTHLICLKNQLTNLDVSNNTALRCLLCYDNLITSLNVRNNTALNSLYCGNNLLTSLDISNNIALGLNGCYVNLLDVSMMPSLYKVCVWDDFSMDILEVNTTGSPNVYFTAECSGSTGLKEYRHNELSIYPNPTNTLLTIETVISDPYSVEINSLNGQEIFSDKIEGATYQIDLSSFQKGVYFITLRSKDNLTTRKIIKQ